MFGQTTHTYLMKDVIYMCDDNSKNKAKSEKKNKGDEDMSAVVEFKPIKSTEINFKSDQECREFEEFVKNPPATSEFVKNLIKDYKHRSEDE